MKIKRILLIAIAFILIVALSICAFVGCNNGDNPNNPSGNPDTGSGSGSGTGTGTGTGTGSGTGSGSGSGTGSGTGTDGVHQHTFSQNWSSNDEYHWHDATCDDTTERADVAMHTFKQTGRVEPTCTESGSITKQCTVCGKTVTETINSTGHSFSDQWSSDDEYHWHDATCNHNVKSEPLAHNYVNGVCMTCQHAHINHTFGNWIEDIPATQESEGHRYQECACGKRNEETIPMLSPFTFAPSGNGLAVTGYTGTQTDIIVPAEHDGKKVIAIAEQAFYYSDITSVSLPDSIKEISNYAFGYCTKLKTVNIPHCTRIGDSAFIGCAALREITLPEDIVTLGNALFNYCSALQKVTILGGTLGSNTLFGGTAIQEIIVGDKVTSVEQYAFVACTNLKYLTLPRVETGVSFLNYYFNLKKQTYTYRGTGADEVEPYEINVYSVGNKVFGLPKDGTDWYCLKEAIEVNGNVYHYSGKPVSVSSYKEYFDVTVNVYYRKPAYWTAEFYYYPECSLERLTITNQLISTYDDVFEGCGCSLDIWEKFPVSTLEVKGATEVYIDEFSWSDYTLYVTRTDGYTETHPLLDYISFEETDSFETAGENTVTAVFEDQTITQTITLKLHTFDDAVFESKECIFNGSIQSLEVTGVPDGTKIEYSGNGQTEPGEYTVTATLTKEYHEPKTLTATLKIFKSEYEIQYVLGLENAENNNPSTYITDGEDIILQDPVRPGWEFLGWYTEETFNNKITSIKGNAHTDYTLYAKWQTVFTLKGDMITGLTEYGEKQTTLIIDKTINGVSVTSIGEKAFYNCSNLTELTIPSTVTSIGNYAFYCCTNLQTITFDDDSQVQSIGDSAFCGCSNLTEITIPSTVTSIGDVAFYDCTNLKNVYYGGTIESWCGITFDNYYANPMYYANHFLMKQGGDGQEVTEIEIPENITAIGDYQFRKFKISSVTIPSNITKIGEQAFDDCDALKEITFAENIHLTNIGGSAFSGCDNLKNVYYGGTVEDWCGIEFGNEYANPMCCAVNFFMKQSGDWQKVTGKIEIPESVEKIGNYQFYGFNNITSVTIPGTVTSIGEEAFRSCRNLTEITIPSTVTSIGGYAFAGCSQLTIYCEAARKPSGWDSSWNYSSRPVVWNCCGITTVGGVVYGLQRDNVATVANRTTDLPAHVTIPQAIEFDGKQFTVTSIGDYAFDICSNLTEITIPSMVTSIGKDAFYNCTNLQTVTFEGDSQLQSIGDNAFGYCSSLTSIIIPSTVTSIGKDAFYNCTNLQTVTFESESQLQSIGEFAFSWCENLQTVTFEGDSQLQSIGEYAFQNCSRLQTVTFEGDSQLQGIGASAFRYSGLTSITIPSTVTCIGEYAFQNCSNLQTITFKGDSQLQSIGEYAFQNCSRLQTVTFEGDSQLQSIGEYAFNGCIGLTSITIPEKVTSIDNNAFSGCTNLAIVTWNAINCKYAGTYVDTIFKDCTNLTTVIFGSEVNIIPVCAFFKCYGLQKITIPASVTSIGISAFSGCNNLATVTFTDGSLLQTIDCYAFYQCSSLQEITIPEKVSFIGDNAFEGCTNLAIVTWNATDCTSVGKYVSSNNYTIFRSCTNLTTVNVGANVTSIPAYAFHGCDGLQTVTFEGNCQLQSIGNYAFRYSGLTSITIPSTVTSIGDNAFYYCTNLQTVTFESDSQLQSIGGRAFCGCSNLTEIIIPSTVTSIDYYAFIGCSQLTIYCEAARKPSGWDSSWNYSSCPVVWGYKQP